jgi:hypothetical protein
MINPFIFTPEIQEMVGGNLLHLIRGYFKCSLVDYVVLNYGYHGPRRQIFARLIEGLSGIDYLMMPIGLTCSEEENIRRMICDKRDQKRIERALASRYLYSALDCPTIDSTDMSVSEVVDEILDLISDATSNSTGSECGS